MEQREAGAGGSYLMMRRAAALKARPWWRTRGLRTSQTRRFPPPRSVEETDACFIVRDANGQALAYVYYEQEPGRGAASALPPPRRFRAC